MRTTSYGISHIKADDWGSVGYGYGYVYASHNICVLAREVVEANGRQAFHFGDSPGRVDQDFFYTLVNNEDFIDQFYAAASQQGRELAAGYADGYNRYLADTGLANLPADCRDQGWVRPITARDMLKVFYKLILRGSAGELVSLIRSAEPPGAQRSKAGEKRYERSLKQAIEKADFSMFAGMRRLSDLGSNMYALGSTATQSGRGMVLGNPHFPWDGPLRWYQIHLTIPGELDVMGASLHGVPYVNIGFNKDVAWSHTVSPAWRFTLFDVPLVPGNPTQYLYNGKAMELEQHPVSIEVTTATGVEVRDHTFYRSVHGWILDFTPVLGASIWALGANIFAVGDANADNLRAIEQFRLMNQASSLDEFINVLNDNLGLPWVHTVAADSAGNAFYGDISVVPNVSSDKLASCTPSFTGGQIASLTGLIVLDGSSTACRWDVDPSAPQAGIIGSDNLPSLQNQTYVTNSNDNHWVTNPATPLTGFSPLFDTEESARSLRTRLGLKMVEERLAGSDGLGAPGFTLSTLQDVMFGSRNYGAELLLDDLVALCQADGPMVDLGDGLIVDVGLACNTLANWDRKQNADSVGPQIWAEFLVTIFAQDSDPLFLSLFETPFDPADPVNTPRDLADTDPAIRDQLMQYLATGVQRLNDNGIAVDAVWGDIHFDERNAVRYPIHGGADGSGMFSTIEADLQSGVGYSPINYGNSYMQTVTWNDDGVVADALLSYSQSSDPENPNYADQTALYANKQWVRLPFTDAEIEADLNYSTVTLTGPRSIDSDNDGVLDSTDNCTEVANPAQRDTDGDGFGNFCDGDLNQDMFVDLQDLALLREVFLTTDQDGDFNGDGTVDLQDLALMRQMFLLPPGPACPVL
ncbi:MAG: penicillin acylase family protein [Gammaproteobacteria bacterium]|nr:penicillin acylase family protein [Gammaproteobacteria bacterium]NNF61903.1 hypothetical protein [Gammaproteobacteria bacterium]